MPKPCKPLRRFLQRDGFVFHDRTPVLDDRTKRVPENVIQFLKESSEISPEAFERDSS